MNDQQRTDVNRLANDLWALWERISINGTDHEGETFRELHRADMRTTDVLTSLQSAIHSAYYSARTLEGRS